MDCCYVVQTDVSGDLIHVWWRVLEFYWLNILSVIIMLWASALLLTVGPSCVVLLDSTQDGCCQPAFTGCMAARGGQIQQNLGEIDFWPVENYLSCREDCQRNIGKFDTCTKWPDSRHGSNFAAVLWCSWYGHDVSEADPWKIVAHQNEAVFTMSFGIFIIMISRHWCYWGKMHRNVLWFTII